MYLEDMEKIIKNSVNKEKNLLGIIQKIFKHLNGTNILF